MNITQAPHREKLLSAMKNPKCKADIPILHEALRAYKNWVDKLTSLRNSGKSRVLEMTSLLNQYKDFLEVELINRQGTDFLKKQKGHLRLDSSVLDEFLVHLVSVDILEGLPESELEIGPQSALTSLSFAPANIAELEEKPNVLLRSKIQDFTIGRTIHYRFSTGSDFSPEKTCEGAFYLAVFSTECKVNLDKAMFQECTGVASRLKQVCPISKYYILAEYLDMEPEDCRLTEVDNVYLLRHTRRLASPKRMNYEDVKAHHKEFPVDGEVIWQYVQQMQDFINIMWYDPLEALTRGSFV